MQIAERQGGCGRVIEHWGSARTNAELEALLDAARRRIRPGQGELDLAAGVVPAGQSVMIVQTLRPLRQNTVNIAGHEHTAADPLTDTAREILTATETD